MTIEHQSMIIFLITSAWSLGYLMGRKYRRAERASLVAERLRGPSNVPLSPAGQPNLNPNIGYNNQASLLGWSNSMLLGRSQGNSNGSSMGKQQAP